LEINWVSSYDYFFILKFYLSFGKILIDVWKLWFILISIIFGILNRNLSDISLFENHHWCLASDQMEILAGALALNTRAVAQECLNRFSELIPIWNWGWSNSFSLINFSHKIGHASRWRLHLTGVTRYIKTIPPLFLWKRRWRFAKTTPVWVDLLTVRFKHLYYN
jgi:hypothetical protein